MKPSFRVQLIQNMTESARVSRSVGEGEPQFLVGTPSTESHINVKLLASNRGGSRNLIRDAVEGVPTRNSKRPDAIETAWVVRCLRVRETELARGNFDRCAEHRPTSRIRGQIGRGQDVES